MTIRPRLRSALPAGEVLRFAIVGVAATLTHFTVLTVAVEAAGMWPVPANGLAFLCAACVTYLGQALWVFRVSGHGLRQIQKFLLSAGSGFLANIGLMALVVDGFGLHYRVGFATVVVLVPLATFLANKFWVFAPHSEHRHEGGR